MTEHSCIFKDVTKSSFISPPSFVPHTKETLEFWNPSRRRRSVDRFSARLAASGLPGADKVTPSSARKQTYTFNDKLETMRQELLEMRAKVRGKAPHWR